MKQYIDYVYDDEKANQFTAIINRNMMERTKMGENLGIYGLKCLRKKIVSLNQMKAWIERKIAAWIDNYGHLFEEEVKLTDPPTVKLSEPYKQILNELISKKFMHE